MPQTAILPDRRESVTDRVVTEILKMIAGGEFDSSGTLPAERKLAETLNVSRVSVRAALQTLKAQGFLDAVQGGGTRIVSRTGVDDPALAELVRLDRSNMRDLMELRCEIEVWAARRAAENACPASVLELKNTLIAMAQDDRNRAAADVAFHMAIAKASESIVYRHLLGVVRGTLAEMLKYHRTELFASKEDDATVMAQHQDVLDAIAARDPDRAADAMRRHLTWAYEHYARRHQLV